MAAKRYAPPVLATAGGRTAPEHTPPRTNVPLVYVCAQRFEKEDIFDYVSRDRIMMWLLLNNITEIDI